MCQFKSQVGVLALGQGCIVYAKVKLQGKWAELDGQVGAKYETADPTVNSLVSMLNETVLHVRHLHQLHPWYSETPQS